MSLKVIALNTDYTTNVTQVTIQLTENVGRIVRVKDTLEIALQGRYDGVSEPMMDALFAELEANGIEPFPEA
jgi:hypothetical protein